MPAHSRGLVFVALAACAAHTPPSPEPEPARPAAAPEVPAIAGTGTAWQVALTEDVVGLIDERFFVWDRAGAGGIAEHSALTGAPLRSRPIAGLDINGAPRYWEPVPGGFLAHWDGPAFIRETDGALSVGWIDRGSDWYGDHVLVGDTMILVANRGRAALVRRAWADGRELWRTPLPPWLGLEDVTSDGAHVHVAMQVYDPNSPTPRVAVPMRVAAFDLATGAPSWSLDFPGAPGVLAASGGIVVAAVLGDLVFFDGVTGRVRSKVAMGRPNIYPRLLIAGDRVIVALNGSTSAVTSFDLATGAQQWSTALSLDGGPELARAGDLVLVTTAAGTVAALALDGGALQWEIGLGVDGHRLWNSPSAVVFAGRGLAGGFRLPPDVPEEQATFHGRVLAVRCGQLSDAVVRVGGTDVTPDAGGNYRATIRARGFVVVGGAGSLGMPRRDSPDDTVGRVSIRLDGRGDYTVPDLTLDRCDSG
jgi:hypothetical protein